MSMFAARLLLMIYVLTLGATAVAHQDETHVGDVKTSNDAIGGVVTESTIASPTPFPVDLGGPFNLVDHNGVPRSDRDFADKYLLVFFGYAHCKSMCTVGLKRMGEAVDTLGEVSKKIQPVMITVDPENDTLIVMRNALADIHPRLLGLTGSKTALEQAYRAYKVNPNNVGLDSEGDAIINHTSYIYLLSPDGEFLTLIPPIIGGERMGEIIAGYMS